MLRKRTKKFATWNVQGLRTKQGEVFQELQKMKIDICVLTETKKKGKGNEGIGEYIHLYSGVQKDARAKRGVSVAVHKSIKRYIKSWEEVDEQIITVEMNKNGHHIVVIGVYTLRGKLTTILTNIKDDKEIYIICLLYTSRCV